MNNSFTFTQPQTVKHFEDLWNEAEEQAAKIHSDSSTGDIINSIKTNLMMLRNDNQETQGYLIGKILFDLSYLSQKINVNVYGALNEVIEDAKTDLLENVNDID